MSSTDRQKNTTTVAVWCASNDGPDSHHDLATAIGKALADNDIELIYGATCGGLMTNVAEAVHENGGKITGVSLLVKNQSKTFKTELFPHLNRHIEAKTLGERKEIMCDLADAFIILPGGTGTLDEFIEAFNKAYYFNYNKSIILANPNGFWDSILTMLSKMENNGYIQQKWQDCISIINNETDAITTINKLNN